VFQAETESLGFKLLRIMSWMLMFFSDIMRLPKISTI
jgi:hypothetical protein